ncbi:MAG TPA: hypothetical protein VJP78_09500 [Thermoleophilia bacterium]|nr:hypothetical protein [Thermoleophilia bacterium]
MLDCAGVYVACGPDGVYVGQSRRCFHRNAPLTLLGIDWGVVVEMPESTSGERFKVEELVAESWAARGFKLVSRNTRANRAETARSNLKKITPEQLKASGRRVGTRYQGGRGWNTGLRGIGGGPLGMKLPRTPEHTARLTASLRATWARKKAAAAA